MSSLPRSTGVTSPPLPPEPQKSPTGGPRMSRQPSSPPNTAGRPPRRQVSPQNAGHYPKSPTLPHQRSLSQQLSPMNMPNIAELLICEPLVAKPKPGTLGTRIPALTNFFKLDISKCEAFNSYTFALDDEKTIGRLNKSRILRRCASLLMKHNPNFRRSATNYTNQFFSPASSPLVDHNLTHTTYVVDYYEAEETGPRKGDKNFRITIRIAKASTFSLAQIEDYLQKAASHTRPPPQIASVVAMLNALLDRPISENPTMVTLARRTKFFSIAKHVKRQDLTGGLEAYTGYFKSVRDCAGGLYLNLNSSAGAFYKSMRLDKLINEMGRSASIGPKLKGLRVSHTYMGVLRIKTVTGLAPSFDKLKPPTADNVTFDCPKHNNASEPVADHYQKSYPGARRNNLDALVVDLGNKVFVPSDLLQVLPAQPFRGLLSANQTSEMLSFACRKPDQNKKLILEDGIPSFQINSANGPANLFNLSLKLHLQPVQGRLLPPPTVSAAKKLKLRPAGDWNMHEQKVKRDPSGRWKATCVELIFDKNKESKNMQVFTAGIKKAFTTYFRTNGLVFQDAATQYRKVSFPNPKDHSAVGPKLSEVFSALLSQGYHLVFVILPDKSADNHYLVKRAADTIVGINTICTVQKDGGYLKIEPSEIANLILKFNQKLGGINHSPEWDKNFRSIIGPEGSPAMFIGADVTHPSPSAMIDAPSIAGVVASYENTFTQYPGGVRLQSHRDKTKKALEMIAAFDEMVQERLRVYYDQNNKTLPGQIVVLRDGVSDGQFAQVMDEEVHGEHGLLRACEKIYKDEFNKPLPKVFVLVAQKRHHTRFYTDKSDSKAFDQNGNPLPGFVVDTDTVSATNFDFYLTSHKTLKGTSRPAKYTVLYDTIGVSPDQIQMLMFHMCYAMGRATKPIGIHPAARCADLLCNRARVYLRNVYVAMPDASGNKPTYVAENHWSGKVHPNLQRSMFYI